jgi:hypothetical protein
VTTAETERMNMDEQDRQDGGLLIRFGAQDRITSPILFILFIHVNRRFCPVAKTLWLRL